MMSVQQPVLSVDKLSKMISGHYLLRDIELAIHQGEIFGILGADGSGKTTLMKIIMGLTKPTQGTVRFWGQDTSSDTVKTGIGYISESRGLYSGMTFDQIVAFVNSLSPNWDPQWIDHINSWLNISGSIRVGSLPKSCQTLLYAALTLAQSPSLILFDEPMEGLDAINQERLLSMLFSFMDVEGNSIIVASRNIGDIAGIIDRFAVIKNGSIFFTERTDTAIERFCKVRIVPRDLGVDFGSIPGIYKIEYENRSILIKINNNKEKAMSMLSSIPHDFYDNMAMGIHEIYIDILKEDSLCSSPY